MVQIRSLVDLPKTTTTTERAADISCSRCPDRTRIIKSLSSPSTSILFEIVGFGPSHKPLNPHVPAGLWLRIQASAVASACP